jgi:hypothetical protein
LARPTFGLGAWLIRQDGFDTLGRKTNTATTRGERINAGRLESLDPFILSATLSVSISGTRDWHLGRRFYRRLDDADEK